MNKVEIVFVPVPAIGHIVSTTEFAKRLLDKDNRFSVTILVIRPFGAPQPPSPTSLDARIRYINIPPPTPIEPPSPTKCSEKFISDYIESHKPHVEQAITEILSDDSVKLGGIVVHLFCSSMIEVANQLIVPSYLFFASGATFLVSCCTSQSA